MSQYRKVSDDEITPYEGLYEIGSPQYNRAQNRKRAAVRRSEKKWELPESLKSEEKELGIFEKIVLVTVTVIVGLILALISLAYLLDHLVNT